MNIKKVVNHIRHSRPKWYKDYHKWEHHGFFHWITFVFSSIIIFLGFLNIAFQIPQNVNIKKANASSATTLINQDVTGGSLTISNTGDQSLSSTQVSTTSANTTGSLGTITVTDNRGSGAGWSATATSTHFIKVNSAVMTSGSNNTVTSDSGSTYSSATQGTYTITITTGGTVGNAIFSVSGLESASNQTTGAGVAIGTRGVTATFASATYVIGDSWTIRVDVIPVTNLSVNPGSVTIITGSGTNVTAGGSHTFSSTSDATALISASYNYGLGSYSVTPSIQLTVPANSYANSYSATVTETVS
jgi:hypothetical protein